MGKLLSGRIEYPQGWPVAIDRADADAGKVLFCSAYAVTDLTIELLQPEF